MIRVVIDNLEDAVAYFEDEHLIWIEDLEYTKNDEEEDELLSTCYGKPQGETLEEVIELVQMAFRDKRVVYLVLDTALTSEEYELIKKHRDGYLGVYWHVDDFKNAAENLEGNGKTYDPDKFQYALEVMVDKHDACIGISWDTLYTYLNQHCVADEESI